MIKNIRNNKGFTLIELMVVISIIAFLSSVVLASISKAREKAVLTKTVSEMRSLQTALEQYKLDNGIYPYEQTKSTGLNWNVDYTNISDNGGSYQLASTLNVLVSPKKYIPKIPASPKFPNNYNNADYLKSHAMGYLTQSADYLGRPWGWNYECGGQPIKKYMIWYYPGGEALNLPYATMYNPSSPTDVYTGIQVQPGGSGGYRTYCLGM